MKTKAQRALDEVARRERSALEREARLLRILKGNGPRSVMDEEIRLVLHAHYGSHFRALLWLLRADIDAWFYRHWTDALLRLHAAGVRLRIPIHFKGGLAGGCWVCENAEILADPDDDDCCGCDEEGCAE